MSKTTQPFCRIEIDGQVTKNQLVWYFEMNFGLGGHYVEDMIRHSYTITWACSDFIEKVDDVFEKWCCEIEEDDEKFGDAFDDAYAKKNWPKLGQLVEMSDVFENVIRDLGYDLMPTALRLPGKHNPQYWIHTLDRVRIRESSITWIGDAYSRAPS